MATHPAPLPLREFCPLYYLLNAIPAKVQKGFRSVLVYLTALDSNNDYIAIGSSIGMLYLYCRRVSQMNKYNLEVIPLSASYLTVGLIWLGTVFCILCFNRENVRPLLQ